MTLIQQHKFYRISNRSGVAELIQTVANSCIISFYDNMFRTDNRNVSFIVKMGTTVHAHLAINDNQMIQC